MVANFNYHYDLPVVQGQEISVHEPDDAESSIGDFLHEFDLEFEDLFDVQSGLAAGDFPVPSVGRHVNYTHVEGIFSPSFNFSSRPTVEVDTSPPVFNLETLNEELVFPATVEELFTSDSPEAEVAASSKVVGVDPASVPPRRHFKREAEVKIRGDVLNEEDLLSGYENVVAQLENHDQFPKPGHCGYHVYQKSTKKRNNSDLSWSRQIFTWNHNTTGMY